MWIFVCIKKGLILEGYKKTNVGLFLPSILINVASYHEWTERSESLYAKATHHVGHPKLELLRHLSSPFVEHFNGKEDVQRKMSVVAIDCELVQPIDVALIGKVQEVLTILLYQGVELSASSRN